MEVFRATFSAVRPAAVIAALAACATSFSFAEQATAQQQGRKGTGTVRQQLEREIEKKRDAMRDGRVIRSSVRVKVRLRNGSKLAGVVKNGRFIERVDGLDFVPADLQTAGAGLRVWYTNNTNSFIFLPYADVAHYRIGERLTSEEIAQIEERIRKAQREAAARRREVLAARRAQQGAQQAKPGEKQDEKKVDEPELTPEQRQLLADFPPSEGWGTERMRDIEVKKITVGVFPDAHSKRFVRNFEEWLKAKSIVDAFERAKKKEEADKKAQADATTENSSAPGGPTSRPSSGSQGSSSNTNQSNSTGSTQS
jgi:hypothetical protein